MGWQRTDDFDRTPADQYTFGWDGIAYTIDLSEANMTAMRTLLEPYLKVGQEYGVLPPVPPAPVGVVAARVAPVVVPENDVIRQWANNNGFQVSPKGRLPDRVREAYLEAHAS